MPAPPHAPSTLPEFFERARADGFSPALLVVAVDRTQRLAPELLEAAQGGVLESWQELTRDLSGLRPGPVRRGPEGLYLPCSGIDRSELSDLARGLVSACRARRLDDGEGRTRRFTVSVGMADAHGRVDLACETWLAVARESLDVALAAGGDRWVHSELYDLLGRRSEAAESSATEALQEVLVPRPRAPQVTKAPKAPGVPAPVLAPEPVVEPIPEPEAGTPPELDERLQALFSAMGRNVETTAELEREMVQLMKGRGPTDRGRVDVLERRIAKLLRALREAEEEIARLNSEHGIDTGIASIYRTVQGLSPDVAFAELKRDLMKQVFEANLELKAHVGEVG